MLISLSLPSWAGDFVAPDCGELHTGAYGPFDYRSALPIDRRRVENFHFNHEYQDFLRGNRVRTDRSEQGRVPLAEGFEYTLHAFPNHPRSLQAMDLMGVHWKTEHLPGSQYRVECYFLRALAYVSDDGIVNALYGVYLARRGRANDARTQFQLADKLEPLNADVQINIAFGLMQTGDWEEATKHARVAYANGYQLPGIRKKLVAKGYWKE